LSIRKQRRKHNNGINQQGDEYLKDEIHSSLNRVSMHYMRLE
jgi:hypothetical protein